MGIEFILSADGFLSEIRFYSGSGADGLPIGSAIYDVSTETIVTGTENLAPSWSGLAGSGWVKVLYDGSIRLTAGIVYKSCILKPSTSSRVYCSTPHYWDTGDGASGITSGIISAPNTTSSDGGQDSFNSPGPDSFTYPASSFLGSNYWIDVGITPDSGVTGSADVTIRKISVSGSGSPVVTGSADVTIRKVSVSGSASVDVAVGGVASFSAVTGGAGSVLTGVKITGVTSSSAVAGIAGSVSGGSKVTGVPCSISADSSSGLLVLGQKITGISSQVIATGVSGHIHGTVSDKTSPLFIFSQL
jgi:hypothetical protein